MKKLSKTQMELLEELKPTGSYLRYMGYMGRFRPNAYYFVHGSMKNYRCSTVGALIKLGLLERFNENPYSEDHEVRLVRKEAPRG